MFRTPEEAIEKANNTAYGLSAGVRTEKGSRILWMAERLRAGVVWANTFNRFDPRRRSAATRSRASAGRGAGTASSRTSPSNDETSPVRKTYKLSSSAAPSRGRSPAARISRRARTSPERRASDARDAVKAARGAQPKWAGATAYNRGQVLYRPSRR